MARNVLKHTSFFSLGIILTSALPVVLKAPMAQAQGEALPDVKVNLPPSPNFDDIKRAPLKYDTGEFSVYGLRKSMSKYLDKDVQVKAYLLEVYECPEELVKCNERASKKKKAAVEAEATTCRPCDQPHFFVSDTPDGRKERALLVADYPTKDWKTDRPKPLKAEAGKMYVVTGTFGINSVTGFAASNGLIAHKRFQDAEGKVLMEGNAVLPSDSQMIELEGKAPEKLNLGN
ncbi:MAG: DUF4115 domain-containing protein [Myxococcales bacterium]|nr:DUF4115 domain-containing protein [Myxococcales bacterium]